MQGLRRFPSFKSIGLTFLCLASAAAPALADIVGGGLTITAITADDQASFVVEAPANAKSWTWTTSQNIPIVSASTGNVLAVINPEAGDVTSVEYVDDPVIGLGFAVQAGAAPTAFFISSALLSFSPIIAQGRASAGFSLTDFNGDNATLTGIGDPGGAQGAYLAQYNGFAGTLSGTTFAEVIQTLAAGSFASDTESAEVPNGGGFQAVGPPVSDMSVLVSFTLSPFDMASGTSVYVMVQRPVAVESATWSHIKSLY